MTTTTSGDAGTLLLTESGASGTFTASTTLSRGAVTPGDGVLQVADGVSVTFTYDDVDDGTGNPAVAATTVTVDCVGPVISGVATSSVSGTSAVVGFTASEPATATVSYGLACGSLTSSVSSTVPSLAPALTLSGLSKTGHEL